MRSIIRDEDIIRNSIDALINIKSVGHIPDGYNQDVYVEDANEAFAIFGKPNVNGGQEYTAITATEYGDVDLNGMMEWLNTNDPELFDNLLTAAIAAADEDQIEDAFDAADWLTGDEDVIVFIREQWLNDKLDECTIKEFLSDLRDSVDEYLGDDRDFAIQTYDDVTNTCDLCACGHCDRRESSDSATAVAESSPYEITFSADTDLTDEEQATLTRELDNNVIRPLLEKYGFINPTINPDDIPDDADDED